MSAGFDRLRGGWTHRRLGLGRTRPSATELAHADAVLTEVGGRIPNDLARDLAPDPVRVALLDFVADLDLTIEPAASPAATEEFDASAYRRALMVEMARDETPLSVLAEIAPRRTKVRDRFLLPAMSAATAAVVVIAVIAAGRGGGGGGGGGATQQIKSPQQAASTESQVLLRHASMLLTAASSAQPAARVTLIEEARSDLQHVSKLLPLINPPSRPAVRMQLRSLQQKSTTASSPKPSHSTTPTSKNGSKSGGGSTSSRPTSGTSGSGTSNPTTQPPATKQHQPPPSSTGTNPVQHHDPVGSNPTGSNPTGSNPTGPGAGGGYGPLGPLGPMGPGAGLGAGGSATGQGTGSGIGRGLGSN